MACLKTFLHNGQNFQTKASQAQFHTRAFQVLFLTISLSHLDKALLSSRKIQLISVILKNALILYQADAF